jgi:hypothetical protein
MSDSEADIERALQKECKKLRLILLKLWPFNMVGIPDRLILAKPGRVMFLELKKPGGSLSALQEYWKRRLTDYGFRCVTTYTRSAAIRAARAHAQGTE